MRYKTLTFLLLVALVVGPLVGIRELPIVKADLTWWNGNWHSRVAINITGSTVGAVVDYPVNVTLHNSVGVDTGSHIYLDGTAQADYDDIRFVDDDQSTLLNFWMVDNYSWAYPDAVFWIKIPKIPISPNTTRIWLYWQNPTANSLSNGNNVFNFFDDFEVDFDVGDWTNQTGGAQWVPIIPANASWFLEVESASANGGWSAAECNDRQTLGSNASDVYGWELITDRATRTYDINTGNEFCLIMFSWDWIHDIAAAGQDDGKNGTSWLYNDANPWAARYAYQAEWDLDGTGQNYRKRHLLSPHPYNAYFSLGHARGVLPHQWELTQMRIFNNSARLYINGTYTSWINNMWNHLPKPLGPAFSSKGWAGVGDYIRVQSNWVAMRHIISPPPTIGATSHHGSFNIVSSGILNMDGCGAWCSVSRRQYVFFINATSTEGGGNITTGFQFTDMARRRYEFMFNGTSQRIVGVRNPVEGISVSIFNFTIDGDNLLVYFNIMFNDFISDSWDVDLYHRIIITSTGLDSGWLLLGADYFSIYNIGGQVQTVSSGWSGRNPGGDAFEIYAADTRVDNMFQESFESEVIERYQVSPTLWTPSYRQLPWNIIMDYPYSNVTVETTYPTANSRSYAFTGAIGNPTWRDGEKGLHLITDDTVNNIPIASRKFRRRISNETIFLEVWWQSDSNPATWTTACRLKVVDAPSWILPFTTAMNLRFDGNLTRVNTGSLYWDMAGGPVRVNWVWVQDQWYNITAILNMNTERADLIIDGVLTNITNMPFYDAVDGGGAGCPDAEYFEALGSNAFAGGPGPNPQADFYIDHLNCTTDWDAPYGGDIVVRTAHKDLQNWHMDFDLNVEDGYVVNKYANYGFVELGWDICLNDTWERNFLVAQINITAADVPEGVPNPFINIGDFFTGRSNWVRFNITWTQNGTIKVRDTLYGFYEGYGLEDTPGEKDDMGFHWDIWFNKMNASTVVGGRLNCEWFGMSDKAPPWQIWTSQWKPMIAEKTDSSCYVNLEDSTSHHIHSVKEVSMIESWVRVWRNNESTFHFMLKNVVTDFDEVPDLMQGINPPALVATGIPITNRGFFGSRLAGLLKLAFGNALGSLKAGGLLMWSYLVTVLDVVFGLLGAPGLGTTVTDFVAEIFTFAMATFGYLPPLITQIFSLFSSIFLFILAWFTRIISLFIRITTIVNNILNGTYSGMANLVDIWALLDLSNQNVIDAIPIFMIIGWFLSIDNRARKTKNPLSGWVSIFWGDLQMIMNVIAFFMDIFIKVVNITIDLLFKLADLMVTAIRGG